MDFFFLFIRYWVIQISNIHICRDLTGSVKSPDCSSVIFYTFVGLYKRNIIQVTIIFLLLLATVDVSIFITRDRHELNFSSSHVKVEFTSFMYPPFDYVRATILPNRV